MQITYEEDDVTIRDVPPTPAVHEVVAELFLPLK
ncbi:hypothetical protein H4W29_003970 [Rhizobium viscosum]|uniref:Uncharacterized protein n=1 Tax=Rhizobium viscosum TaxID=1673 RepID=A0ABR9IUA5_RHIVS|nr:hypothetical protein [Rhizobium viscosum]